MWAPQIGGCTDPFCSKYFGYPWLYQDEEWSEILGLPAEFVLQLNITTLPTKISKKLGGKGLLQFSFKQKMQQKKTLPSLVYIIDYDALS